MFRLVSLLLGCAVLCAVIPAASHAAPAPQSSTVPAIWLVPDPATIQQLVNGEQFWDRGRLGVRVICVPHWWLGDETLAPSAFVRDQFGPALRRWGIKLCVDVGRGAWWHPTEQRVARAEEAATLEQVWWDRIQVVLADTALVDYVRIISPVSSAILPSPDGAGLSLAEAARETARYRALVQLSYPSAQIGIADWALNEQRTITVADAHQVRNALRAALGGDPAFIHLAITDRVAEGAQPSNARDLALAQEWLRASGTPTGAVLAHPEAARAPDPWGDPSRWTSWLRDGQLRDYRATGYNPDTLVVHGPGNETSILPETEPTSLTHLLRAVSTLFQTDPLPSVSLHPAERVTFPPVEGRYADSNSPGHWDGGTFFLFNSVRRPFRSTGGSVDSLSKPALITIDGKPRDAHWLEATFRDDNGVLYGWYHLEPEGLCPSDTDRADVSLTAPMIGAMRSTDNGARWKDLGIIISAPGELRCDTENHYYAGGVGDFSVMLERDDGHFYFLFTSFSGSQNQQGVAVARMPYDARDAPVGQVARWHRGAWDEPGLGGQSTIIFPVPTNLHRAGANAFWGPSIHWNRHLQTYVILLNRSFNVDWWQEGAYASFNRDLANPRGWTVPRRFKQGGDWYTQVIGLDASRQDSDKMAGQTARYFEQGISDWEITFERPILPPPLTDP
ncbi:MAG: hypothetical protein U0821_26855 [Chloroflexota bacterium]